jgi:DNA-binding MarR family transcriptional regulator
MEMVMTADIRPRDASLCNCGALRKASRRVSRIYDEALAPTGLGSVQHSILAETARWTAQPPTLWELADALVMDRSTIARNLRPLERDGYLTVLPSETDRRRKLVTLTSAGQAKLAQARVFWLQAQKNFEKTFGMPESVALRSRLLAIANDSTFAASMKSGAVDQP